MLERWLWKSVSKPGGEPLHEAYAFGLGETKWPGGPKDEEHFTLKQQLRRSVPLLARMGRERRVGGEVTRRNYKRLVFRKFKTKKNFEQDCSQVEKTLQGNYHYPKVFP